tara:strand:- start:1696 stop:2373 length:678 start_codon:yes stop_codon:yes gene_type:complete
MPRRTYLASYIDSLKIEYSLTKNPHIVINGVGAGYKSMNEGWFLLKKDEIASIKYIKKGETKIYGSQDINGVVLLTTRLKDIPFGDVDLTRIPDSLKLVVDKKVKGDFNADNKLDFAVIVKNKNNQKTGVLIIHNSTNQENYILGAGKGVYEISDLEWIEVFETLPKGKIISPTIVDKETGDIIGQDETRKFKLVGNGIKMSVEESHGGLVIFWNGKEYKWYLVE